MKNKSNLSNFIQFTALIIATAVLIILAYIFNILYTPLIINKQDLRIQSGMSVLEIANLLKKKEVIPDSEKFILAVKIKGKTTKLRSGYYKLETVENYSQLIDLFTSNQQHAIKITIPEGSTIQDIAGIIAPYFEFSDSSFIAATRADKFITRLDLDVNSVEGYLFPDTYYFYPDARPEYIINKMINTLHEKIDSSLAQKIESSKYNFHEILTMASIVEGECIVDSERPLVASLYYNRINTGMHLNADPTIQYIIDDAPRRILHKDLKIESPYNTYLNYGLPPGPVNNPGLKSIQAAADPIETNFLYMVAKGNGEHYFTRSYNKFLDYKRKFQRVRRKVNNQ